MAAGAPPLEEAKPVNWQPYLISLAAGVLIGVIYGLINVRSPAPPIIALLGLLGILAGESTVAWVRGHTDVVAKALHLKSFEVAARPSKPTDSPDTKA
jgi:XapX domain-containing protein